MSRSKPLIREADMSAPRSVDLRSRVVAEVEAGASRRPSALTPTATATVTATETIRPASRTFR